MASEEKELIRRLTRYRWSLPALAELHRSQGCKFVTLMRRLGASDKALRQSLNYLIAVRWVERNPGYGHPLRPEYIVTEEGQSVGSRALALVSNLEPERSALANDRWALTVIASLTEPARFGELLERNAPITPRALAMALKKLAELGLLRREVTEGFPPGVTYSGTEEGDRLVACDVSESPSRESVS